MTRDEIVNKPVARKRSKAPGAPRAGERKGEKDVQLRVVFMRPKLTSKHTMAMLMAAGLSFWSLSFKILLVLLLLAMASM